MVAFMAAGRPLESHQGVREGDALRAIDDIESCAYADNFSDSIAQCARSTHRLRTCLAPGKRLSSLSNTFEGSGQSVRAEGERMPNLIDTVADLSHHNANPDFAAAAKAGVYGVIHKATQGQNGVDATYALRRPKAEAAGLRWGAYHFGTGSDGVKQAQAFLATVGDPKRLLLVLDLEGNPSGPSMSLEEARAFVTHVQGQTGIWPGIYSGHYIKELLGAATDPILAKCWFWLAQYGPTAVVPPNWSNWTLWQYTDGSIPKPQDTPGFGHCDRERFNGSAAKLTAFWNSGTP